MSIIQVIHVDLGDSIEQIISDDVRKLSEETLANIKTAAEQKVKVVKEDPETAATMAAYMVLFNAIPDSVEISKLLEASNPAVTNPSALMMRMKALLRKMGNEYIIRKHTRGGKVVYCLIPYNHEDADNSVVA